MKMKEFEKMENLRYELWKEFKNSYWEKGEVIKIEDILNPKFYEIILKYNIPFEEIMNEVFVNQWFYYEKNGYPKGYTKKSWKDYFDNTLEKLKVVFP